ncbi:alpha/beta hydrolase [Mycobacterium sp. 1274761.0]|uniref:alpha/beta hydrolase n=1 Tax=Mycobacterium sp. 1274761.0 TaxID=1834077 RepID=UPI0007FFF81B|nr:alpha/beta hydrolase [Mycobacterium sp. 1274761.0]OBK72366.1 lipase [Mycobacterium sp. 1274761.0]
MNTVAARPDLRDRLLTVTGGPTLRAVARMPDSVKRALLGGRSVSIDGNTLDTTLQFVLTAQRLSGREGLILSHHVPTARRRLNLTASRFPRLHVDVTSTDFTIEGPAGAIPVRHYRPRDGQGAPLLVFYHGGGFVVGGLETHGHLCELICQNAGLHVLFVGYRLAPEHKAPAAIDDAYAGYLWAREHAAELGADPQRVAVGGDSAGGNLTAVVTLRSRDDDAPRPALQLLLYPVTNFAGQTRSYGLFAEGFFLRRQDMEFGRGHYIGGSGIDPADPRVSPLLADDLAGLPPSILVTTGFDPLRDEGRLYAEALRAAGNSVDFREYGSLIHAFPNFMTLGGGSATAMDEIISALQEHLSRS